MIRPFPEQPGHRAIPKALILFPVSRDHLSPALIGGLLPQVESGNLHLSGKVDGGGCPSLHSAILFGSPEEDESGSGIEVQAVDLLDIAGVKGAVFWPNGSPVRMNEGGDFLSLFGGIEERGAVFVKAFPWQEDLLFSTPPVAASFESRVGSGCPSATEDEAVIGQNLGNPVDKNEGGMRGRPGADTGITGAFPEKSFSREGWEGGFVLDHFCSCTRAEIKKERDPAHPV